MNIKKKENKKTKVFITLLLVLFLAFSISFSFAWFTSKDESSTSEVVKFGSVALDVKGSSIDGKNLQVNVSRKQVEYQKGGKIMPGDTLSIDLDVALKTTSQPAYYVVKISDTKGLFEQSTYFADGTTDSSGKLIVYQTDGINTWVMGDKTQTPVVKYVGKLSNTDTHSMKIEAVVDEETGNNAQKTTTTVNCEILAIQQAHLSEQQARPMLIDFMETGYSQVEYIKVDNGGSSNSNGINTGVSWSEVGAIDVTMQFTSVPSTNSMIFATYSSNTNRTAPYIYADNSGIAYSNISGTASESYTKTELTNNGQKSFRISGINSQNTGKICFGSWQDNAWSASWECSGIIMYNKTGKVIRNFIPSVRTQDSAAGFYDAVNKTFYTNLGSNTFTTGAYVMSSNYTRIEYLESTGSQYINTGVTIDPTVTDYSIETSIMWTDTSTRSLMGYNPGAKGYFGINKDGYYELGGVQISVRPCTTSYDKIVVFRKDTEYRMTINNDESTSKTATVDDRSGIFKILWLTSGWDCHARVKSCKITVAGKVVRDFVPCYRNTDKKPGLYDMVSGEFFTNAGTGEFVIGE